MSSNISEHIEEEPIEDCSDQEGDAPLATETPSHVFGPFAALVGSRQVSASIDAGQDDVCSGTIEDLAVENTNLETGAVTKEGLGEEIADPTIEVANDEETYHDDDMIDRTQSLCNDASINEDGTITGGPTSGDDFGDDSELPSKFDLKASIDAKVDESFVESDSDPDVPVADDFPDEAWTRRPAQERELWERMRPRHVRREAARVTALKFPNAPINRIEKLHPDLQTKTSDFMQMAEMRQQSVHGKRKSRKQKVLLRGRIYKQGVMNLQSSKKSSGRRLKHGFMC